MNRRSPESATRLNAQRGWRGFVAALAMAVVMLIAGGAMPTVAADKEVVLNRLERGVTFKPARRGAAVSVGVPPTTTAPPPVAPLTQFEQYARDVIRLTNIERQNAGVAPVQMHLKLNQAAGVHARDMASKECKLGVLSHTGSDGSNAGDRIARTGLVVSWWSENIGCGQRTPESIMRGWMKSDGHRANLLNPALTHIGVAVAESSDGILFWAQDFAIIN